MVVVVVVVVVVWGGGGSGGRRGGYTIYFHNSKNVTRYKKDDQQKKRNVQAVSVHVLTQFPMNSVNELCKKKCKNEAVPLVEFLYLVFTRMPGVSYRRRLRSLLLYLCYVYRALINSPGCWFYIIMCFFQIQIQHRGSTRGHCMWLLVFACAFTTFQVALSRETPVSCVQWLSRSAIDDSIPVSQSRHTLRFQPIACRSIMRCPRVLTRPEMVWQAFVPDIASGQLAVFDMAETNPRKRNCCYGQCESDERYPVKCAGVTF